MEISPHLVPQIAMLQRLSTDSVLTMCKSEDRKYGYRAAPKRIRGMCHKAVLEPHRIQEPAAPILELIRLHHCDRSNAGRLGGSPPTGLARRCPEPLRVSALRVAIPGASGCGRSLRAPLARARAAPSRLPQRAACSHAGELNFRSCARSVLTRFCQFISMPSC
jgi:hypothetical protein